MAILQDMIATFKKIVRPVYWGMRNWRFHPARAQAYGWNWRHEQRHTLLSESDFRASRRSETIFIYGSGYSLNSITPAEWEMMAQHNTLSFNWFIHQNFIRTDYHVFREISWHPLDRSKWQPEMEDYFSILNQNPHYQDTILLMQKGWMAVSTNRAIGLNLLDRPRRILRYTGQSDPSRYATPTASLQDGVIHHLGTLSDCVHLAYIGGWKNIVLVGVDLYDRRYFWLGENELRADEKRADINATHNTAQQGIVDFMGQWGRYFATQGVHLWCYNPRSLLTQTLQVYPDAILD